MFRAGLPDHSQYVDSRSGRKFRGPRPRCQKKDSRRQNTAGQGQGIDDRRTRAPQRGEEVAKGNATETGQQRKQVEPGRQLQEQPLRQSDDNRLSRARLDGVVQFQDNRAAPEQPSEHAAATALACITGGAAATRANAYRHLATGHGEDLRLLFYHAVCRVSA